LGTSRSRSSGRADDAAGENESYVNDANGWAEASGAADWNHPKHMKRRLEITQGWTLGCGIQLLANERCSWTVFSIDHAGRATVALPTIRPIIPARG